MKVYWLNLEIGFIKPIRNSVFDTMVEDVLAVEGEFNFNKPIGGFLMDYGVTAPSESEAIEMVIQDLNRRNSEFEKIGFKIIVDRIGLIEHHLVDAEIVNDEDLTLLQDPKLPGIYYRSGRAFFQ